MRPASACRPALDLAKIGFLYLQNGVWDGFGFGNQALLVLPEYDVVAVVNSCNQFGAVAEDLSDAVVFAVVEAAAR